MVSKRLAVLLIGLTSMAIAKASIYDNLQPVRIATNMQFTEGPAWHPNGYLVFSDINGNSIYKWSEQGGLETFAYPSGNSNGIACKKDDRFVVCRHSNHDVARMEENGAITSLVSNYNGKRLNSPNDVVVSYRGSIYFTDPDYGVALQDRELTFQGLYCIPYNQPESLVLLDSTLVKPNGLAFVNDWRNLYVCESSTNTIYTYSLRDDWQIQDLSKDKKVFLKVSGNGEIDGITADIFGYIYVAFGDGGIKIFDKDANEVGSIAMPEKTRNLCFGGKYENILFVTAGNSLYKIDIRHYGDLIAPGLLGAPTSNSVIFNALSDKDVEAYITYGVGENNLNEQTSTTSFAANEPIEINISGLNPNTHYYYQLWYKLPNEQNFKSSTAGEFNTQRAQGEIFSFAVEADPHLDEGSNYVTFRNTLQNALNLKPDFLIDLGDNFMVEKFPLVNFYYIEQRSLLYRNFWDNVCKSMPLFIVQGNHDTELRWLSTNSATDPFNTATTIRKKYYPTPEPNFFYSGNDTEEPYVGERENYYSWTWGDALFVVIDPYGYTELKPTDPWGFTLGKTQYDWFRKTLEESKAKFKFVFAHQIVGGDNLGRGGAEKVDYFEMGGKNLDGTYGFDTKRPGWGKPLHQIMVENGVQIFFHGHDHFYGEQVKDGIIYQEVPQPSFPVYNSISEISNYGYQEGVFIPSSGHLNVKILGDSAQVDYIGGYHINNVNANLINGQTRRTYYVKANSNSTNATSLKSEMVNAYQSGDYLIVKSQIYTNARIYVFSITGQQLKPLFNGELPIGESRFLLPSSWTKGIYLAKISGESINKTVKIIK